MYLRAELSFLYHRPNANIWLDYFLILFTRYICLRARSATPREKVQWQQKPFVEIPHLNLKNSRLPWTEPGHEVHEKCWIMQHSSHFLASDYVIFWLYDSRHNDICFGLKINWKQAVVWKYNIENLKTADWSWLRRFMRDNVWCDSSTLLCKLIAKLTGDKHLLSLIDHYLE